MTKCNEYDEIISRVTTRSFGGNTDRGEKFGRNESEWKEDKLIRERKDIVAVLV